MSRKFHTAAKVRDASRLIFMLPHILMVRLSPAGPVIAKDVDRWLQEWRHMAEGDITGWRGFVWLLSRFQEFRNLLYYRIERAPHLPSRILLVFARWFLKPCDSLFLFTPVIGPGLFIEHGFSTVIAADSIGQDCWINQQVTVGYSNKTDCPKIGDRVRIAAGAKVFGGISIGNDVVIGANAVVCKNVPPNCTVVGVPARIVRRAGCKVSEPL